MTSSNTKLLNKSSSINLDRIFKYSVQPELNIEYKTTCILLDVNNPVKLETVMSKLINQPLSTQIKTALANTESGFKANKITESMLTLELQNPVPHMMNFVFLKYDTGLINKRSLYRFLESLRELGGHIYYSLSKNELRNFNFVMLAGIKIAKYVLCVLEGFLMAMYSFKKYKSAKQNKIPEFKDQVLNSVKGSMHRLLKGGATKKARMHPVIKSTNPNNYAINIVFSGASESKIKGFMLDIGRLVTIMKSIYMCRDLINEPGNILTTSSITNIIPKMVKDYNVPLDIKILTAADCKKLGMGLLVAVGSGSDAERQSGLVILTYNGVAKNSSAKSFCLIGKGITQDTGGYSLKDVGDIVEMKSDKSGACIMLATIMCCARLQLPVNIVAMLPLAQNSIGPSAMVPGDIVTAYNGLTVEITDPDAEGRLILADCIAYAVDKYPGHQIIDMATLTFEQEAVSCKKFSTLIEVNSADVADKLVIAGEIEGERIVKMPFIQDFEDAVASDVADLKNSASTCQGDIYPSAMFMASFLKADSRWIHIDLGGNTFKVDADYLEPGALASGVGVKLLMNLMLDT